VVYRAISTVTFDEDPELVVFDISSLKVLLECEEENQQELVVLVETTACVAEHLECQIFNHIVQSLGGKWRLLRSAQQTTDHCIELSIINQPINQSINQCFYFRQRGPYETEAHTHTNQ